MKKVAVITLILCSGLFISNTEVSNVFANENMKIEHINVLTQNEALDILTKNNDKINYIYQGNENDFEQLKEIDKRGYVFLPDIETDLGYFVDKNTGDVYYFHPSGYMELI